MEDKDFIGKIFPQNCGDSLKVLSRNGKDNASRALYECEFIQYPCKIINTKSHILEGKVQNYYIPNKFGFFFGRGKYDSKNSPKALVTWNNLQKRCFDINSPYYKNYGERGIIVCDEWKCFQNFAAWYEENSKWNKDYVLELDKDVLGKKIYSPSSCLLVPSEINKFLVGYSINSGIEERCGHYRCRVQHKDKIFLSETYSSFEEVRKIYIEKKQEFWKDLINQYILPQELKDKLLNFKFK
jgi:hypothetical protein